MLFDNPYNLTVELTYSSYALIARYEEKTGNLPSGLFFNKSLSFISTEIKEKGIDIRLPHCWYRWGDEVVRYFMPPELEWTHEEADYTLVNWNGSHPDFPSNDSKKLLDDLVTFILEKYSGPTEIKELVNINYLNAPFEFQKKYKRLRDFYYNIPDSDLRKLNGSKGEMLKLLRSALSSFPQDPFFKDIRTFLPTFDEFMFQVLDSESTTISVIKEILEEFWYWFCYFLRAHPSAHENVPDLTVAYWVSRTPIETVNFEREFREHLSDLSNSIEVLKKNKLFESYLTKADSERIEFNEVLEDFQGSIIGLDEFLKENKTKIVPKDFN